MYEDIIRLLDSRRLKEACNELISLASEIENWQIKSEVEALKTTYGYMLQYAAQGMNDPGRAELYDCLLRQAYELASRLGFSQKYKTGKGYFAEKYQTFRRIPLRRYGELGLALETLLEEMNAAMLMPADEAKKKTVLTELAVRKQKVVDELFDKTWYSDGWTDEDYNEAMNLLRSAFISENDIAVLLSGVTLNLLLMFDSRKFRFLVEAYKERSEAVVVQRALIGVVLSAYYHGNLLLRYPEFAYFFASLKEDALVLKQLHFIQVLFLLSHETEKIDRKMREEIIPEMMKNPRLNRSDLKISDIEDLEDLNPEWKAEMEKINNHIREIGELQMEGADTYMSTFSQLKRYPFFTRAAHWFYPFDKEIPEVAAVFDEAKIGEKSLIGMMLNSPIFCNSDKYSFCFTIKSIPTAQREALGMQLGGQNEMSQENLDRWAEQMKKEDENHTVCRQYIHDLYRFFKLWMFKHEQEDIFEGKLDFWNCNILRPLFLGDSYCMKLADYFFSKKYYAESIGLYQELIERNVDDSKVWQRLGFAFQKEKEYRRAIHAYERADLLKPNHGWTLKHLGQCHKRLREYDKAIEFFCRVEEMQPDDLNLLTQIGQCLAQEHRYKEALSYFFKVEYWENAPVAAWRAIAWCYFMIGNHEDALKFYDKLHRSGEANAVDYLNAGHVFLVRHEIILALEHYRKSRELCKSFDDFMDIYLADKETLIGQGVAEIDLSLIPDLL